MRSLVSVCGYRLQNRYLWTFSTGSKDLFSSSGFISNLESVRPDRPDQQHLSSRLARFSSLFSGSKHRELVFFLWQCVWALPFSLLLSVLQRGQVRSGQPSFILPTELDGCGIEFPFLSELLFNLYPCSFFSLKENKNLQLCGEKT